MPVYVSTCCCGSFFSDLNFRRRAEFISGVSQFSVKGDKDSKLRFAFRIYDMDNDGFISNGELFQVRAVRYLAALQSLFFRRWLRGLTTTPNITRLTNVVCDKIAHLL